MEKLNSARGPKELGEAIAILRKGRRLTQQQLGEMADIKQNAISVIESGAEGVRISTLFKILAALELEIVIRKRPKSKWSPEDTF